MDKSLIWDPVRKKRVAYTPEEGVRQWLINKLNNQYNYPLSMMFCEYSLKINNIFYRSDLVVFGRELKPLLVAEIKAPTVKIDGAVFNQVLRYNLALQVKYLLVTNGNDTFLAKITSPMGDYQFITDIPHYNELSK